ncbi:MAG: hypothetical protein V1902_02595 [Candidatus Falkowbacteria bacterium]
MYSRHYFPNQKANEFIILFLRRHWIEVAKIIVVTIGLCALPLVVYIATLSYISAISEVFAAIFTLGGSAFYLFVILYTFSSFIDYYLDVWIVTNQRIINIEQKGLFDRVISEKELGRMQDITSTVEGFCGTIFHYGNVQVQTAGEEQHFLFKNIPYPEEVARTISNLVSEYKKGGVSALDVAMEDV